MTMKDRIQYLLGTIFVYLIWFIWLLVLLVGSPFWLYFYFKDKDDSLWVYFKILTRELFLDKLY